MALSKRTLAFLLVMSFIGGVVGGAMTITLAGEMWERNDAEDNS